MTDDHRSEGVDDATTAQRGGGITDAQPPINADTTSNDVATENTNDSDDEHAAMESAPAHNNTDSNDSTPHNTTPPITPTGGTTLVVVTPDNSDNNNSEKKSIVTSTQTVVVTESDEPQHPDAVKLKFIFANKDGLTVMVSCKLTDSVGEVKGVLMSMWPDALSPCAEGDRLRLICMGKGLLMPDTKSLAACEVPVFKTHATPINVSVRPDYMGSAQTSQKGGSHFKGGGGSSHTLSSSSNINNNNGGGSGNGRRSRRGGPEAQAGVDQGCSCVVL